MRLVATRLEAALGRPAADVGAVAVSDGLRAAFVLGLQRVLPGARVLARVGACSARCGCARTPDEVALLRRAAHAADRVDRSRSPAGPLVGRTEADVASEVRERLLAEGHEQAEFWIVASGPNSASPHHDPGERVIRAGEPIVHRHRRHGRRLRLGHHAHGLGDRRRPGERARTTTSAACTTCSSEAQAEATAAVRPGVAVRGGSTRVARGIITDAGFGPNFLHRTGHGIGLEGHEEPYIVAGNARAAGPGLCVQRGARASTSRAATAPGSRTSWSAATPGRTRSTRRPGTCSSSPAERSGPHVPDGRRAPGVSSGDPGRLPGTGIFRALHMTHLLAGAPSRFVGR